MRCFELITQECPEMFYNENFIWFFNSREALAAIIGDIVVFTIQELDCIGALSFFVRCF